MSVSRPPVLAAGDQVRFGGEVRPVIRLTTEMALLYGKGADLAVPLADLFAAPDFAVITAGRRAPLPPEGLLRACPLR